MLNVLVLAAGYVAAYCVHTPHGREFAKKAISEAMKSSGSAEKGILKAILPAKSKKEE